MKDNLIIESVIYKDNNLSNLKEKMRYDKENLKLIFQFPTVYIIISNLGKNNYEAYVGETNNIERRTVQHLNSDVVARKDFKRLSRQNTNMLVIGHNHFNKSLTLDIESRMILYLLASNNITKLDNRRTNNQSLYYTKNEFNTIFKDIWHTLHTEYPNVFPLEREVINSAIYKSAPFHRLNDEQFYTEKEIEDRINKILNNYQNGKGQLILVEGDAGTGKTVLLSHIFNKLNTQSINNNTNKPKAYILVNQHQQMIVYQNIVKKLGLDILEPTIKSNNKTGFKVDKIANNPATFINDHSSKEKVDVVLVDEAHLLWTQGVQGYRGENELDDLLNRAKVVVAIFDPKQMIKNKSYIENKEIKSIEQTARLHDNIVHLNEQMRMKASKKTVQWINDLIFDDTVKNIPDDPNYELKIGTSPQNVYNTIKSHNNKRENSIYGLSRMIATFDWPYKAKSKKDGSYWNVKIGSFILPWNLQLPETRKKSIRPWVEIPQSIDEVGSSFTIQGFDLNYAGLIIGPSVKFRNGKVIFDSKCSYDKNITQKRTLSDGKKYDLSNDLLKNSLNVLMKRGIHGLLIYAVDDELRNELIRHSGKKHLI